MYIFLIVVHVVVSLVLITVVLLQAGRGGGFSEMIGGSQPQSIFGTQTNAFMMRTTEVCAVLFIVTSLSLGVITSQSSKSLMGKTSIVDAVKQAMPAPKAAEAPIKTEAAKAVAKVEANAVAVAEKAVETATATK